MKDSTSCRPSSPSIRSHIPHGALPQAASPLENTTITNLRPTRRLLCANLEGYELKNVALLGLGFNAADARMVKGSISYVHGHGERRNVTAPISPR